MVDVTKLVPDQPLVTSEAPRSEANMGALARPVPVQNDLSPALDALSQTAEQIAIPLAEKQGREDAASAVTRNPDGSLNVTQPPNPVILGQTGIAYQHAVEAGTLAAGVSQSQQSIADIAARDQGNPQQFRQDAADYTDGLKSRFTGPLGASLVQNTQRMADQHYSGLVSAKATQDVSEAKTDVLTQIEDAKGQMIGIARQNGTDSPEYQQQLGKLNGFYDALGKNPLFGYSATQIASEKTRIAEEMQYQGLIGHVDNVVSQSGVDAAVKSLQAMRDDPNSTLSAGEREKLYNYGVARAQYQTEDQKAQATASAGSADAMSKLYQMQKPPTDDQFDAQIENLRSTGDNYGAIGRLQAAREAYMAHRPLAALSPSAQQTALLGPQGTQAATEQGALAVLMSKGWTQNQASGVLGGLIHESGGKLDPNARNPGDGTDGSDSIGIGQWNGQRAKDLVAFAQAQGKPWNDLQTQLEFVDHELKGSEISAGTALQSAATPEAAAQAALGYERPQGYVPGGDPSTALGWQQRLGNAQRLAGGGASTSPISFTPQQIKDNPYLVSAAVNQFTTDKTTQVAWAKTQISGMESMIRGGVMPSPVQLASVQQIADGQAELAGPLQELHALAAASPVAAASAGAPNGQAVVDQAQNIARQSPSLATFQYAQAVKSQYDARTSALQENPQAYAARSDVGWISRQPIPLDPSDPQKLVQGLQERRAAADAISTRTGQSPDSLLFTKPDLDVMKNSLATLPAQAVAPMIQGLSGLTDGEQGALADNKDFSAAIGGMLKSGDPAKIGLAAGYMQQQFQKNAVRFEDDYGKDSVTKMNLWNDLLQYKQEDEAAKIIQRWDDPATARARDELKMQASTLTSKVASSDVVKMFGTSILPFTGPSAPLSSGPQGSGAELKGDYDRAYSDAFALSGGDKDAAQKGALTQVQAKWGTSAINGGRVMAYPPDKYYPQDAFGGQTYVSDQLRNSVAGLLHNEGMSPIEAGLKAKQGGYSLISDDDTRKDIGASRSPSYQLVYNDASGNQRLAVQPDRVTPLRFRADSQAPINQSFQAITQQGQTRDLIDRQRQGLMK